MAIILDILRRVNTLTFDCYGTLVDWRAGLRRSLGSCFGEAVAERIDELFDMYVELEAQVEAETYRSYRQVTAQTVRMMARRMDLTLPPGREAALAGSLPDWPLFPDTNAALVRLKQRYRLGVLSNIDRDLFAGTSRHFQVPFDFVVTAEDVRSYKPAHGHFHRYLEKFGSRETTLHVAQSLYHDGGPANALGIAYAWINRYGQPGDGAVAPDVSFPSLASLADIADESHGH